MTHWRFSFQHPTSLGSLCHWPRSQTPVASPCAARTVLAMLQLVGYHPKVPKPSATGCMKNTWQVFETHKASSQSICCYGPGVASDRLDPFDLYDDMIIEEIKHSSIMSNMSDPSCTLMLITWSKSCLPYGTERTGHSQQLHGLCHSAHGRPFAAMRHSSFFAKLRTASWTSVLANQVQWDEPRDGFDGLRTSCSPHTFDHRASELLGSSWPPL